MLQKRWIATGSKLLAICLLSFINNQALGDAACADECRTYRDGSPTRAVEDGTGGGGGSSTTDTIALSDAPFGVTKVLRQCDFTPSYTIKCSGTYVLGEPIKYQGTLPNAAALNIAASDVTVNLNGYSLVYEICGATHDETTHGITFGRNTGVSGITVCPGSDGYGRKNITIRNGAVRMFTGYGIRIHGKSIDGLTEGPIKNVTVNEITANDNKIGMSFEAGDTTTTIKTVTDSSTNMKNAKLVSDVRVLYSTANCNDHTGIRFDTTSSSEIVGSTANENGGTANSATTDMTTVVGGFDLKNSRKLTLKENTAICNSTDGNSSSTSYGIFLRKNVFGSSSTPAEKKNEDFAVVESVVDKNIVEVNGWGIYDQLEASSTVYTRNFALNNGTSNKNGSGNYFIKFNIGSSGAGSVDLANFTETMQLADLHSWDNTNTMKNISIGLATTNSSIISPIA